MTPGPGVPIAGNHTAPTADEPQTPLTVLAALHMVWEAEHYPIVGNGDVAGETRARGGTMDERANIKSGVSKRASAIRSELDHWIAEHVHPADSAALGIALMRMAAHEYSDRFDKAEILEMFAYVINERPSHDA